MSKWHALKIQILKAQGNAAEAKKEDEKLKKITEFGDQKNRFSDFNIEATLLI